MEEITEGIKVINNCVVVIDLNIHGKFADWGHAILVVSNYKDLGGRQILYTWTERTKDRNDVVIVLMP